ncbi:MAG: glycosyltransferase 87 family protein [Micrococcales bacterium]|nr:glycosyltransferase 87 family protein [Micrococcales bacterium]
MTLGPDRPVCATQTGWSGPRRLSSVATSTPALWAAFAAVHLWTAWCGVRVMPERVFWDLGLYRQWVDAGLADDHWPVLDEPWVYPAGALAPLVVVGWLARALPLPRLTADEAFAAWWTVMVTTLNLVVVLRLLHLSRRPGRLGLGGGRVAAWWWVGFLAALGPVAVGRIDALVTPLVVVALLVVTARPRLAAALLTVGAWVKVAPGVLLLPVVLALRRSWPAAVGPAAAVSTVVLGTVALLGGREHVWSFLGVQGGRGMQVEAVGASPWLLWGLFSTAVQRPFNSEISTYEVTGPGVQTACDVLDGLFYATLLAAAALLAWRAWGPRRLPTAELVTRGSLLLLLTMVVTNKVLSPQYLTWLVAPVVVALAWQLPRWRGTAGTLLGVAAATQVVFPWAYTSMITAQPAATEMLVVRNVGLVVLWVVTARAVVRPAVTAADPVAAEAPG